MYGFEKSVDAGEMRQLAAGEGGYSPINDRVGPGQPQLEASGDFRFPFSGG
jgi:hypothetical protein